MIPNEAEAVIEYLNGLLKKTGEGSFDDYFYSIGLTGMAFLNSTSINIDAVVNANLPLKRMLNSDKIECSWKIVGKKKGNKFHYTIYYATVNTETRKVGDKIDCIIYNCDNKKTKEAKTTVIEQTYWGSDDHSHSSYVLTETDMDVKIEITFTSDIVPLKLTLTDGDGTVLVENVVAGETATTYNCPTGFVAGKQETKAFKIVINWVSSDNDNAYLSKTASYSVSVTGTQKIAA